MAIVTVPANIAFTDFDISLEAPSDELKSPFNGKRQVAKLPYDIWYFNGKLVSLDADKVGPIKSFLVKLAGKVNSFRLKIAGSKYPVSGYAGPPGVTGGAPSWDAAESSAYIQVTGLTPGASILKNGDYFNIGDELKVATLDRTANGAGVAFIYFMPPLRTITTGQALTITDPFLYLHASRDDVAKWKVTAPVRHAISLEAEETI